MSTEKEPTTTGSAADESPIDVNEFAGEESYTIPAQKSVKEIIEADNNDESLKR